MTDTLLIGEQVIADLRKPSAAPSGKLFTVLADNGGYQDSRPCPRKLTIFQRGSAPLVVSASDFLTVTPAEAEQRFLRGSQVIFNPALSTSRPQGIFYIASDSLLSREQARTLIVAVGNNFLQYPAADLLCIAPIPHRVPSTAEPSLAELLSKCNAMYQPLKRQP